MTPDDATLGGYQRLHQRPPAFGGPDGRAYSAAILVDDAPDAAGRYGAGLLFVRWSPAGDAPDGHVETDWVAFGSSTAEAKRAAQALTLQEVKDHAGPRRAGAPAGARLVAATIGVVLSRTGARYRVWVDGLACEAVLRGRMKQRDRDTVLVGDRVRLETGEGTPATIEAVLPRASLLQRRSPGRVRGERAVAAMAEAMEKLCRDPELRLRMGAAARERARADFHWARKAERMNAL